jgi:hypothetical protein
MIALDAYFSTGYYIGAAIFIGIFALVYWFAGRLGWFGLLVRIVCAVLIAFKLFQVLFTHP